MLHSRKVKTLWAMTRGQRLRFAVAVAAMAAGIVLLYLSPQIVRAAIDGLVEKKPVGRLDFILRSIRRLSGDRLGPALGIAGLAVALATALGGLLQYLRGRWTASATENMIRALRERLYAHLQHLPVTYHDAANTGDLVQRCTSDVDTIRTFYSSQLIEIARALLLLATAIPVLIWMDWRMTLVAVALIPIIIVFSAIFFAKVQKTFKAVDESEGRLTTVLQENLTGIRVVRAFARQDFEKTKFRGKNADYRARNQRLFELLAIYWATSDFLGFLQLAIVLFAGAYRVSTATMSVGTLVAFLQYEAMVIWPVRQMGRILTDMGKAIVSLGRIEEILAQPRETEPERAQNAPLPPRLEGHITIKDVNFDHRGKRVLDGISLSIAAGETVAVLGPSGAGKSTLVNLLLRFYDYPSGSITIDGRELRDLDRKYVRSQFGVVMQEPFLFSKTVRENIALSRHSAQETETIEAASSAAIHESIEAFDLKYETLVGERGVTLSGGQRQRVAIARALLLDAPILILDDALSAVDTRTEAAILGALRRRRGRRTTIVIAHRICTLSQADHIVVLDHGKIVQYGAHEKLVAEEGLYRRLWQIQGALEEDLRTEMTGPLNDELTDAANASSR